MTEPSTRARPGFEWMAAQAAAASGYAGSSDWTSNGGAEPDGTPIRLVLKRRPANVAFGLTWRRAWDKLRIGSVMFVDPVSVRYASKAALTLAIVTPDAPMRAKPPLSRTLVVATYELTSAWMPDIDASAQMTRGMPARASSMRK